MTFEIFTQENADGENETVITVRYVKGEDLEEIRKYIALALFSEEKLTK